jgi:hypothetical protein
MGDASTNFNTSKGYYELTKKDWQQGQRFQLVVNTNVKGQYLYVFSVNSAYRSNVHFPLGKGYGSLARVDNSDLDNIDIVETFEIWNHLWAKKERRGRTEQQKH